MSRDASLATAGLEKPADETPADGAGIVGGMGEDCKELALPPVMILDRPLATPVLAESMSFLRKFFFFGVGGARPPTFPIGSSRNAA
jgi:hypothetical protein